MSVIRLMLLEGKYMIKNYSNFGGNHRKLRVGELIKQNLGQIFLKNEAKIPSFNTNLITITEVKMSSDLKSARAYVIPLGGKEIEKTLLIKHCHLNYLLRLFLNYQVILH